MNTQQLVQIHDCLTKLSNCGVDIASESRALAYVGMNASATRLRETSERIVEQVDELDLLIGLAIADELQESEQAIIDTFQALI